MTAKAQLTAVAFYRDPEAALAWLAAAFGFETSILLTDGEGRLAHAEMDLRGVKLGVAGEWEGGVLGPARMRSPAAFDGQGTQFCRIELPPQIDIDQHCAGARLAGAQITQAPQDEFYGDRTYRALDLEGHVWNFSQPRRTVSPAEITAATGLIYAIGGEDRPRPAEEARSAVTPYVSYRDPKAAYAWLEAAFSLEPRVYVTDEAGDLVHAEMSFRGQTIGVSRAWSDRHATPADVQGRNTQTVHLQLASDIDGHHARAVAAGAEIIRPLETQAYGDRTYLALDLEGHVWSFGQTIAPMSSDQWDAELGTSTTQRPSTR